MFLDHVAVLGGDFVLQPLDLRAGELDHLARLDVHHVVVVLAAVEFVHRLAALEIVLEHQARRLELGEHAVDGGQADVVALLQQLPVDVLGREVPGAGRFEHVEDADSGVRDLEAGLAQVLRFHAVS